MSDTIRLRYMDKAKLPEGEWTDEHDLEFWTDEGTGYRCLVVRTSMGTLCGYVEVPDSHPWHEVEYGDCVAQPNCGDKWCTHGPGSIVDAHGGLTFSGDRDHVVGSGWWFGFDCAHYLDLSPYMLAEGLASYGGSTYRDVSYVRGECVALARQLAEVQP